MKTKGMGIALLSAAALLGSAVAQAELPWTYAEFGYSKADGNDFFETDAMDLKGSIAFLEKWHASLQYTDGESESDIFGGSNDFDGYRVIVGAHPQLTPNTQAVFDISYSDYEYDDGGEGSDAIGIGFGLRHSLTDKLEIMSEIWYSEGNIDDDGGDFDYSDTSIEVGGRYNWMPQLSTGLTVGVGGGSAGLTSDEVVRFDVRWSFGDVL